MLWTLVASPLTATANQTTTFTLTATNLDPLTELGCLEVDLPPSFVIVSVGTPMASNGDPWTAIISGQAVIVRSLSGGGRLNGLLLESVSFTIRARPTAAGAYTWPNHAHRQQDCSSTDQPGTPLAITVLPGASPTPSPSPSPTPSASPLPSLPLPSLPVPSLPLPSLPLPSASPSPSPGETRSGSPSPTPTSSVDASRPGQSSTPTSAPPLTASGSGQAGGGPSNESSAGSGGRVRLAVDTDDGLADLGAALGAVDLLADVHVWFVPAAAIGVPGLLLMVWVALQAAGVLAWIPAVRRMRGDDPERRRMGG
jgi:hypothetical protein